jgi:hypothetical protein
MSVTIRMGASRYDVTFETASGSETIDRRPLTKEDDRILINRVRGAFTAIQRRRV